MFKITPKNALLYLKFQIKRTKATLRKWHFKLFPSSYFNESLPHNYKFIVFGRAVSGKHALFRFLSLCGLKQLTLYNDDICFLNEVKKTLKEAPKTQENYFLTLIIHRSYRSIKWDFGRVIRNANLLILLRDPISRCKGMLNHGTPNRSKLIRGSCFPAQYLNTPPHTALDRKRYKHKRGYSSKAVAPSVEGLSYVLRRELNFTYYSSILSFLNPQYHINIHYLDVKELMPKVAFKTMQNLAEQFNFTPPKEEDRDKFEQVIWNKIKGHLPFELIITPKDFAELKENIKITIIESHYTQDYEREQNRIDIKDSLLERIAPLYADISLMVKDTDVKLIKESQNIIKRLKEYFAEFTQALKYWVDFKEQNQITEEQVLAYFKENKALRVKFKKMLDKELIHIKQTRPDIVESWKYYKEFERICEEDFN